jgi:hypothetical protein
MTRTYTTGRGFPGTRADLVCFSEAEPFNRRQKGGTMKHLLTGVAIAALFAVAAPTVSAQTSPGGRDTTVNQNRPMTPGSSATDDMNRNRQGAPGTTTRDTTPSTQGGMSSSGAMSGQGSMSSSGTMSGQSSTGAAGSMSADRPMKADKTMKSSDKSMKNRSASGGSMSSNRSMSGSGRETSAKATDPESGSTAELNRQELQRLR